jgi:hypothetical protein
MDREIGGRIMAKIIIKRGFRTRPWTLPARRSRDELDGAPRRQGGGLQMSII